jgi:hypothetical protein
MKNRVARTVGVYGEAFVQFELARRGWVVDAVGATALGIDLLAWKQCGPNMGINVKARLRNTSGAVTLFKDTAQVEAMREECRLRGVEPYVAVVVFGEHDTQGYLLPLDRFLERHHRKARLTTKSIDFYRTVADLERYKADSNVIKFMIRGG